MMISLRMLILISFSIITLSCFSQVGLKEKSTALQLVNNNLSALGLTQDDLNNIEISSTYHMSSPNLRMVYLQQTYKTIPVFNQMQVLAFKNDILVSSVGNRIRNLAQLVNNAGIPQQKADQAIKVALSY